MWKRAFGTVLLLLVAACAHQEAISDPPAAAAAPEPPTPTPVPVTAEHTCAGDDECNVKQLCIQSRCVDIAPDLPECNEFRIHFEFDGAKLRKQDLPILQRASRCLTADTNTRAVVEGNTDERGTAEYNLVLGERRASAVRDYLQNLGVPVGRLRTVSYGKEMPLCGEHTEACWAQNRRAAVQMAH